MEEIIHRYDQTWLRVYCVCFELALIPLVVFACTLPLLILLSIFFGTLKTMGGSLFEQVWNNTILYRCMPLGFWGKLWRRVWLVDWLVGRGRLDVGIPETDGKTETNYHIFSRNKIFLKCLRIFHICTVPYSTSLHSSVTKREPLHYQVDPYSDGGEMPAFMDIRRS